MDNRKSAAPEFGVQATPAPAAFRIRYGRCAIALVGLLALLSAAVTLILLAFGVVPGTVPLVAGLVTFASVTLLRTLAVRSRRAKVQRAFADAMSSGRSAAVPPRPAASPSAPSEMPQEPSPALFDAESGQEAAKRFTPDELRAAALAVAVAAGDPSAQAKPAAAEPSNTPWEPVEVPKPVYVDAAKAERPAPEPLEFPEAPKAAAKTTLKQSAAVEPRTAPALKSHSALSNLDDVLQRRRA
ncbi:hypothetical protein V1638_01990 [Pseudarthrobacter sp. J64]|uniref:hypothetical protein n=1 Tax=Pseudarthrobacter sp. J64 TaxID=3116485 RepID=UPI002E821AD0|nr:hypothetical protein [Pseudarthrobacter sp. J64]MEE2568170.1 hypothetical protein [Pseudarthrobacter sp. J64]